MKDVPSLENIIAMEITSLTPLRVLSDLPKGMSGSVPGLGWSDHRLPAYVQAELMAPRHGGQTQSHGRVRALASHARRCILRVKGRHVKDTQRNISPPHATGCSQVGNSGYRRGHLLQDRLTPASPRPMLRRGPAGPRRQDLGSSWTFCIGGNSRPDA